MILIIGLGNPGEQFKNTPHNVGFEILDTFARENGFPDFELSKKFKALTSEKDNIFLAKPQTFMNESGKTAKKILAKNKDQVKEIIVVHDDIDLPVGKIKIVKERGSAGHKGVESIIKSIGNENLIRIRVGVSPEQKPAEAKDFVLKKHEIPPNTITTAIQIIDSLIKNGLEKVMSEFN